MAWPSCPPRSIIKGQNHDTRLVLPHYAGLQFLCRGAHSSPSQDVDAPLHEQREEPSHPGPQPPTPLMPFEAVRLRGPRASARAGRCSAGLKSKHKWMLLMTCVELVSLLYLETTRAFWASSYHASFLMTIPGKQGEHNVVTSADFIPDQTLAGSRAELLGAPDTGRGSRAEEQPAHPLPALFRGQTATWRPAFSPAATGKAGHLHLRRKIPTCSVDASSRVRRRPMCTSIHTLHLNSQAYDHEASKSPFLRGTT